MNEPDGGSPTLLPHELTNYNGNGGRISAIQLQQSRGSLTVNVRVLQ